VTAGNPELAPRLTDLTNMLLMKGLDPVTASRTALKILDESMSRQSYFLAYGDAFYIIAVVMGASAFLLFFVNKPHHLRQAEG